MSVRLSIGTCVCLHPSFKPTDFGLDFCTCVRHERSSSKIESQGHEVKTKVSVTVSKDGNVVGLTSMLDQGQFVFQVSVYST